MHFYTRLLIFSSSLELISSFQLRIVQKSQFSKTTKMISTDITFKPPKKFNPTPFAYHEEIEIDIEDLTNIGLGVGRKDGWVGLSVTLKYNVNNHEIIRL